MYPRLEHFLTPTTCSLSEARNCLHENEVVLWYILGPARSYLLLLDGASRETATGGDIFMEPLPPAREIQEWVEAVLNPRNLGSISSRALEAEGYRMLMGPVAERIRNKNLVIIPAGALSQLPFELLVSHRDPATGHVRFVTESHAIRYAPSMTVLQLIKEWDKSRVQPTRAVWALADPVYDLEDERLTEKGALTDGSRKALANHALENLPRLRFSGQELAAIQENFNDRAVNARSGLEATEDLIKTSSRSNLLAQYRVIHLAAHGTLATTRDQQPSLVFSLVESPTSRGRLEDGFLNLDEILSLRLNADLVVLSACHTGGGVLYGGEGIRSLARGFLHAGSRGVVCSQWQVNDRETASFMDSFYKQLKAGRTSAQALQSARVDFIRAGKPPRFWAPFVLFGD